MAITDGLATLAQVKTNLDLTDSVDDTMLELCIESASRQIEQFTERIFTQVSATRVYTPRDSYVVETDDIYSITHWRRSYCADRWDFRLGSNPHGDYASLHFAVL